MARKQHSHHFIYKTTCIITNRFYVGMHSTSDINDGYLGSGKRLWNSIKKHGRDNHKIEILEFLPDRESLKIREKELVNEDLLKDSMCMNLKLGGEGGNIGPNGEVFGGDKFKGALAYWSNNKEKLRQQGSRSFKKAWANGNAKRVDWTNKKHTTETKVKIGLTNSEKQKGQNNSQFGTCWINKDSINKKIQKERINEYIELGWKKGRV